LRKDSVEEKNSILEKSYIRKLEKGSVEEEKGGIRKEVLFEN
ncbi:37981_t:CDS:1, partial [Gigaspora margarita]